ncbi:hypothetical protein ACTFIR_003664 [Dictyostelium discoideum]
MRDDDNNNNENKEKYLIDFLKRKSYSGPQIVIVGSKDKKDEKIEKKRRKIKNQNEKIRRRKRAIELEAEIRSSRDRVDQLRSGINELRTSLEDLKKESNNQKKDIELLKQQMNSISTEGDKLFSENTNLRSNIDAQTIESLQDAALVGEHTLIVTVCQYYLQYYLLPRFNSLGNKMVWDEFKGIYYTNPTVALLAPGISLNNIKELCTEGDEILHEDRNEEIIKIIHKIKKTYEALPSFTYSKNSLLCIFHLITYNQSFS